MIRLYLLIAGVIAAGLGAMILLAPVVFYAGYGIDPAGQVNLLNELRSHGLSLLAAGLFIGFGAFRPRLAYAALIISTVLYLAYGLSRLVAIAMDGLPSSSLLLTGGFEIVMGLAGLALILRTRRALVA